MSKTIDRDQMAAYSEAVRSGLYAKKSGLVGKYDNVRRYWEDEITRIFIRPALHKVIKRSKELMRRIRILDLGCGSADGYELLSGIRHRDPDLHDLEVDLLSPDVLGLYKGIELNEDLIEQARTLYSYNPKLCFEQGDFTNGLPLKEGEGPYDVYFTSYGTCSHHNDDETLIHLLSDIARHTEDTCVVVCDWLGRYSYEWQSLWTNDFDEIRNMDYVVSYIYEPSERERRRDELQHLNLRLMSRGEAEDIIKRASAKAGVEIKPLTFFDRSTFTGRHMDTMEYNPYAQPIREAVNALHEANLRTDLNSLIINYAPKAGFDFINNYFEHLQLAWNALVHHVRHLLELYDEKEQRFIEPLPPIPGGYPQPLRDMMQRMQRVIEGVGWIGIGLPRENIIEPQLGYALRHLMTHMQQGLGCAHGLVAILEINRQGS